MQYRSPYAPMTEEERMLKAIQKTRNPYTAPMITMESQVRDATANLDPKNMPAIKASTLEEKMMLPPEQDFSEAEGRLANQRAYANSLRGQALPEGQRVGPSNIYVRNPWDSLEVGFNRALGGYLTGKNRKESEKLGEKKKAAGLDRARAQARMKADAERQRRSEADRADTLQVRGIEEEQKTRKIDEERLQEQIAARKSGEEINAENETRDRDYIGWIVPETGKTGNIRQGGDIPEGAIKISDYASLQRNSGSGSGKAPKWVQESKASSAGRLTDIDKAAKFLTAFNSGASSGRLDKAIGLGATVLGRYTDQGKFSEELDSFAERAARAELKANGEIRPTDADVKGMKESLFGVGKDENVNINLLSGYLERQIAAENALRAYNGEELLEMPDAAPVDNWYENLFETNTQVGDQSQPAPGETRVPRTGNIDLGPGIIEPQRPPNFSDEEWEDYLRLDKQFSGDRR